MTQDRRTRPSPRAQRGQPACARSAERGDFSRPIGGPALRMQGASPCRMQPVTGQCREPGTDRAGPGKRPRRPDPRPVAGTPHKGPRAGPAAQAYRKAGRHLVCCHSLEDRPACVPRQDRPMAPQSHLVGGPAFGDFPPLLFFNECRRNVTVSRPGCKVLGCVRWQSLKASAVAAAAGYCTGPDSVEALLSPRCGGRGAPQRWGCQRECQNPDSVKHRSRRF